MSTTAKFKKILQRARSFGLGAMVASAMALPTTALGWDYANVPLFWDAGINPNVALMFDDSGSMQALVTNESYRRALDAGPLPTQGWYWCNGTYTASTKKCGSKNGTIISSNGFAVLAWEPPNGAATNFTVQRSWKIVDSSGGSTYAADCEDTDFGFFKTSSGTSTGTTYSANGICKGNHGFVNGDIIEYISNGTTGGTNALIIEPTTTVYYVVNSDIHGFRLATTPAGAPVAFNVKLGTAGTFGFRRISNGLPRYISAADVALCDVSKAPGSAGFYVGVTGTVSALTYANLPTADTVGVLVSDSKSSGAGTRDSCVRWKLANTARSKNMSLPQGRDYDQYSAGTLYYTPGHSGTDEYGRYLLNTLLPATGFNSVNFDDSTQYPNEDADTTVWNPATDNKVIPNVTRIQAAREVGQRIVLDFHEVMNIGLFSFKSCSGTSACFNGETSGTSGEKNLDVPDGTDTDGNKEDLIGLTESILQVDMPASALDGAIGGLNAENSTPLAETQNLINLYYKGTSSPIEYRCQKNYSVLMTDGDPTNDSDTTEGVDALDDQSQLAYDMDARVDADGTDADGAAWGEINADLTYDKWEQQNVITYTVGFGLENDLLKRTPLVNRVKVPTSDVNAATDVITLKGHGLETGDYIQVVSGSGNTTSFPQLSATDLTKGFYYVASIDADTFKLATTKAAAKTCASATPSGCFANISVNAAATDLVISTGPGKSFFSFTPQQLAQDLGEVFNNINTITSSSSAVSTNAKQFGAGGLVFQARFKTEDWSGEVLAYEVEVDETTGKATVDTSDTATPFWTTRTAISDVSDRAANIFTWNTTSQVPVNFDYSAVDAAQQAALGGATEGPKTVNWMKGQVVAGLRDHSDNGLLGDILNSDPIFLAGLNFGYNMLPPSDMGACTLAGDASSATGSGCTGAEIYSTFVNATKTRPARLFVGANDGMLHVLDGANGQEKMVYVPGAVYQDWDDVNNDGINNDANSEKKLFNLARPNYDHRFSVDGNLTVADAFVGTRWKTYMVGGLGAGGRSIFALDVTDTTYAASDVKWEFTNPNLGYTYGKPIVARLPNNEWYAIMPNGLDSAGDNASVFFINLATGVGKELTVDDGDGLPNGMMSVQVRLNGQRTVTDVYAGDMRGNIWKFDLYNEGTGSVSWATPSVPLFTARDSGGMVQSITGGIRVGRHPDGIGSLVYFGTGKYFEKKDNLYIASTVPQVDNFYGVLDNGTTTGITRDDLVQQSFEMKSTADGIFRTSTQTDVEYSGTGAKMGWHIDLLGGLEPDGATLNDNKKLGERVVSNPVLYGGRIIFVSIVPQSGGTCGGTGSSWLNELDALTGGRLEEQALDVNGDGKIDAGDGDTVASSVQIDGLGSDPSVSPGGDKDYKVVGSTSATKSIQIISETKPPASGLAGGKGRMSWKQLQ